MEYEENPRPKVRASSIPRDSSSASSSTFVTTTRHTKRNLLGISIVIMMVSTVLAVAATGVTDYSTSTENGSILGNKVISDTSFTISNDGVKIATQAEVGTTVFPGPPLEMTDPYVILRTNTVSAGNFVYKVTLTEATALTGGTWNIYIFKEGVQIGQMVKVKQQTPVAGTTEGAIVIADLGSTYPSADSVFEVRIIKG